MARSYVGQTVRFTVRDIVDTQGNLLVDPVVTIKVVAPPSTETTYSTTDDTITQEGTAYWVEFEPTVPGIHEMKVSANADGGSWRAKEQLTVDAF